MGHGRGPTRYRVRGLPPRRLRFIKSGHYVIQWQGHAITVHCGSVLDGRKWKVGVKFMCSRGPALCMARAEVEAMLLGEVVRDPEAEARILQQLLELHEAFTARHQAPHRRRMRMQLRRKLSLIDTPSINNGAPSPWPPTKSERCRKKSTCQPITALLANSQNGDLTILADPDDAIYGTYQLTGPFRADGISVRSIPS